MTHAVAPYGAWRSPVTSELIARIGSGRFYPDSVESEGEEIYWVEQRPLEGGRNTLLRRNAAGVLEDLTPAPFSTRSGVHNHGGFCYAVAEGVTFFSNGADGRLYRLDRNGDIEPLTPEMDVRYTNPVADGSRGLVYCVMEDHRGEGEEVNTLVAVPVGGGEPITVTSGRDFYASPRLSPDASKLAWVCWDHPNMPWDGTELWVGALGEKGLKGCRHVTGGERDSIVFPRWSPDGRLHFISDRSGYSNLYRVDEQGVTALGPDGMDCGGAFLDPLFNGGYDFLPDGRVFCVLTREGSDSLALLDPASGQTEEIPTPFTYLPEVRAARGRALVLAAGPDHLRTVALISPEGEVEVVRSSPAEGEIDPGFNSHPITLAFPSTNSATAHGFLYLPANPEFQGPEGEAPPLVVTAHGGPIGATNPIRSIDVQFFTSRGVAVLDVNYRGSTGYGRAYREALYGRWGEADVDDCIAGARHLVDEGLVDPARIVIRGGSAGGYTALASLAFRDFYAGGISRFGPSDLELFMLPGGTYKYESRTNVHLIGPYPEAVELYRARSPVHHADAITVPVLLLQGAEDPVVPPEQTSRIAERLQELGRSVVFVEFEGEGHGFRKSENIKRSYDLELEFLASVFGLPEPETNASAATGRSE